MNLNRKNLDRWARDAGFANFDTYIQTGGSILDARRDIKQRIRDLESALAACNDQRPPDFAPSGEISAQSKAFSEEAQALILEHNDAEPEPPDPHNAHPQGAEHEP